MGEGVRTLFVHHTPTHPDPVPTRERKANSYAFTKRNKVYKDIKMGKIILFGVFMMTISAISSGAENVAPANLRCEYLVNPQGIDIVHPRLSWVIEESSQNPESRIQKTDDRRPTTDDRGLKQTAYQILVASTPELLNQDKGDFWDSGKVVSDQSNQVAYNGKTLASRAICYWNVKVWTSKLETGNLKLDRDEESEWSAPAQWSMGLLKAEDWNAKWISMTPSQWVPNKSSVELDLEGAQWIWLAGVDPNKPMGTAYFTKTISIHEKIKSAVITITGDDQFTLKMNGGLLGKTTLNPNAWASPLSVDLKGKLKDGDNILEVQAEYRGGTGGIVAKVQIVTEQGKVVEIVTDASWQSTDNKEQPVAQWQASQEIRARGIKSRGKVTTGGQPKSEGGLTSRNSPMLRKVFDIYKPVKSAQVSICGLGYYEMFLNGTKVGDHVLDPAWTSYHKNALYVTYDISKDLKQGGNAIGVQLANGMYNQEFGDTWNIHKAPWKAFPQMILQLDITYDDGTRQRVVSDESWKVSDGPIYWDQLRMGVMYDARREQPGWNTAGFDDSKWQPAILREGAKGKLAAQMSEPIKVMDTLKAVNITKQGDSYVYDFGQNISGWTRLNISGKAGTEVVMDHNQTRMHLQTSTYTLKGVGTEIWEPNFAFYGFGKVAVTGLPGEPSKDTVEARVVHTAFDERGAFECSNPLLNKIVSMCRWSYVDNFVGIPSDCPHREKLGWTADAHLASEAGLTYFGSEAAYTRWMLDYEAQQAEDGKLPCIVPDGGEGWGTRFLDGPAWESAYLIIPWNIYQYRGDRRILERHYENYKRWIAWYRDESKIIDKKRFEGGGCKDSKYKNPQNVNQGNVIYYGIGDWPPNGLTPFEITSTAYYYNAARIISKVAGLLGKKDEEKEYADLAAKIKDAFNRAFYDEATGTYSKGSHTGMSCALYFGLVEEKNRQKVADNLAEGLRKNGYSIKVGCLGSKYLLRALAENGHMEDAYKIITKTTAPGWGFLAASGRSTLSESLDGGGSDNHAFLGDVAAWMIKYLAGIRFDPAHPGFKHFLIKPEVVGDLTSVKAHHDSPYGRIVSEWKRGGDKFSLNVTVPANSTAEVYIPSNKADDVMESGQSAIKAKGVKFLRMENNCAVYAIGSGTYRFQSALQENIK